ncbi:transglycosylase SLT domain-containing protein [Pseudomonas matsuisoli]|uniref:Transglycosylase SLT domain-containing protein n=1 Tax=Pseudomonas matsuisoli TaxID=1515666 RepID=A0A917UVU9_9PSED|nr:transglycosylase SLT domain-containing protein [Pseudomonas matsuisoli]GGJ88451.1 hypothetical protein GCM10009304_12700 [Pseudomonas matsuisoli]
MSTTRNTSDSPTDYDKIKTEGGPFDSLIQSASARHGVSYDLLHKQLFIESSFNPNAVSPTGPRGLAQFTKSTGRAYGLVNDEDFFDPAKSIDAAARHMRDNIKIAGGDELKALLAYNQGAGQLGQPQLDAYGRGDFKGVSKEGLEYIRKLRDVTNTGRKAELDSFFTQSSESFCSGIAQVPSGVEGISKVQEHAPTDDLGSFHVTGKDVAPKATPFAEELYRTTGKTDDEDRGFFEGRGNAASVNLKTSVLGMLIRAASSEQASDFSQTFSMMGDIFNDPLPATASDVFNPLGVLYSHRAINWADGDYDRLRSSGLDPQFYDVVLRGRPENFEANLVLAKENQKMMESTAKDRFGAAAIGSLGGLMGDPTILINPARSGGAGFVSRLAGGSVANAPLAGMSEVGSAKTSGREMHLVEAVAGGAAFGGTLNGLFGRRPGRNSWDLEDTTPEPQAFTVDDFKALMSGNGQQNQDQTMSGTVQRLQVREQARMSGLDEDPTAMPFRADEKIHESPAGDYLDVPFDPEAARLTDGTILSGGSPINPKTLKDATEIEAGGTANWGVRMGSITEMGVLLGRSDSADIRAVAKDLFRSSTGYRDGSNGKFGATASDISERLRSQDNVVHNRLAEGFDETLKDPFWRGQRMTEGAKREYISRRVVEALEAQTPGKLTPPEMKLLDELKQHMNQKWDYISNPAQFGDLRAKAILEDTRHFSTYFPQRYSSAAKHMAIERFGSPEELQKAIAHSWMASYVSRPHVKQRIDAMIQEGHEKASKGNPEAKPMTPEEIQAAVEKYANDKAYGVAHSDEFTANGLVEEHLKDGAGLENNSYLEARNLFDSDMSVQMPDGQPFAVNDLRDFNILRVVPQYDRRVNGDIAIMGGTGMSTKELKNLANGLNQKAIPGKNTLEAEALLDAIKMLTGRARRDPDGIWATYARSLTDIGFATKNAYMGVQNITEAAALITKGHQRMLFKGVPLLKKWATAGSKLDLDDIQQMHGMVFGKELDDLIRPTRQDIVDQLRQHNSEISSQIAGTIKKGTQELSVRSPFTWLLRESGNYLMDAGRQGVLVDLIDHTLNGKVTDLFSPERLRSASISPEQFNGIQGLIRDHFRQDPASGKWRIENPQALASDVRSMDLYRLGDRVADETMLRPHKMSFAPSKQYGAGLAMALQFKMFVLRSLNGRMVRGWMEATKNGQALDQTYQAVVSIGLATAFYIASTYSKAQAMPERAREAYLDKALNPSMLAYAAISRSSHVGAPLGVANYLAAPLGFDQAAMVRTSILPRDPRKGQEGRAIRYNALQSDLVGDLASGVAEQVPALGVLANGAQAGYSGYHLLEDQRGADRRGHMTGLWNALKQFVPNDPATQSLMRALAEDQGVDRAR